MLKKPINKTNTCGTCAHFYQHYIKYKDSYKAVYCGHCVYPMIKTRNEDQSCHKWEAKEKEASPVTPGE